MASATEFSWPMGPVLAIRRPRIRRGCNGAGARRLTSGCRGAAVIKVQQTSKTLATRDRRGGRCVVVDRRSRRRDQPVVEALVVALEMVVLDELGDRESKVAFAERDQLAQALRLDGQDEALRERVEFGLCAGSLRHSTPAVPTSARNSRVNSGSRSWRR